MTAIELLAPARTADIGIEAVRHGADAVYIGAPRFGARAAAGNSVEDIARLVEFAHRYKARVYVTVNTLIYDNELTDVERLIRQLWEANVDALIIQDLRLLTLNLPPIPLHASTQMDNRTVEQVQRLAAMGFPQVVLARELTIDEIATIHSACPDVKLEVFVHGALCVGRSGRCNISEHLFGRSANRGECAQVCRMKFDLIADGKTIVRGKHLLSLRDNCQIDNLERLLEAGAVSLKIEGRLKDADYVKNVTAAYSEALNRIIAKHPERYKRASSGHVRYTFTPNVFKSFNRGFVADVSKPDANFDTPKSLGEPIDRSTELHNGDGLCYIENGELVGLRVNNAEKFRFPKAAQVYRNQDQEFDRLLSRPSADRRIGVVIDVYDTRITMTDEDGVETSIDIEQPTELARTPQTENIMRQLSKLGDTPYEATAVNVHWKENYFVPSSVLTRWRRELMAAHLQAPQPPKGGASTSLPTSLDSNSPFRGQGGWDFEVLMLCKHCIRRQLGMCLRKGGRPMDMQLRLDNGRMFRLEFDCRECVMRVLTND